MKPWIKILIGAISGFAGGFAAGFLFHKKLNDIQFEEIDEEEMAKIAEDLKVNNEEKKPASVIDKFPNVVDLPEDEDKLKQALQGKTDYIKASDAAKDKAKAAHSAIKDYSDEENADGLPIYDIDEEDLDENFLEMLEEETVEPGQMEPPHIISLSEFYNERPEYDKITIEWYDEDDVYLDENEEIIDDITTYVGSNAKNLFNKTSPDGDPDICFVRNERYGSDYEIVRRHCSYHETFDNGKE